MRTQIRAIGERTSALIAGERLLTGMRSHVPLQQPRTTETFTTVLTFARQRMRSDVHLQRAHTRVDLRTRFAGELFTILLVTITMKFEMLTQTGFGRIRFTTVHTGEVAGLLVTAVRL